MVSLRVPLVEGLVLLAHPLQQFSAQALGSLGQRPDQLVTVQLEHADPNHLGGGDGTGCQGPEGRGGGGVEGWMVRL